MPLGSKTVELKIPINWLIGVPLVGAALIVAYVFVPERIRPILVFAAAVAAGCAALITAINNVDQRAAAADKAEEAANVARISATLAAFDRWNHPLFFRCKHEGRVTLEKFKDLKQIGEQIAYLKEDSKRHANLLDLLNTFEGLSIAIDHKALDEQTARRFFRGIILQYWHATEGFIKNFRAEANNPRLYKEFENLYNRWKD